MTRAADSAATATDTPVKRRAAAVKRKSAAAAAAADGSAAERKPGSETDAQPEPKKRKVQRASPLETTIGYRFRDKVLLERALTHISALKGQGRVGSYQRLEFLGDHVLGLAVSEMLFEAFPKAEEGELSRRLADLVRR